MADAMYYKAAEGFLTGQIDWLTDTIKVALIDAADYSLAISSHQFLSDVPAPARVATVTLTGKSATSGAADASDVTFPTVTGDACDALIVYQDTGVEGTSRLILWIDSYDSFPITPDGLDIQLAWPNDAYKIFKL